MFLTIHYNLNRKGLKQTWCIMVQESCPFVNITQCALNIVLELLIAPRIIAQLTSDKYKYVREWKLPSELATVLGLRGSRIQTVCEKLEKRKQFSLAVGSVIFDLHPASAFYSCQVASNTHC